MVPKQKRGTLYLKEGLSCYSHKTRSVKKWQNLWDLSARRQLCIHYRPENKVGDRQRSHAFTLKISLDYDCSLKGVKKTLQSWFKRPKCFMRKVPLNTAAYWGLLKLIGIYR